MTPKALDQKKRLNDVVWNGVPPYHSSLLKDPDLEGYELQGWTKDHPLLHEVCKRCETFAEVGVWKGAFTYELAKHSQGHVLAVDHFRGSVEHWERDKWSSEVRGDFLYKGFLANMMRAGVENQVTPLPLDSVNAALLMHSCGVKFDCVHIDGGHDRLSVETDLFCWSPLADCLLMDDYDPEFSEVVKTVDSFVEATDWSLVEAKDGKALLSRA